MPFFAVVIEGQNFPGRILDQPDKTVGFFTTRWLEAATTNAAEMKAIELVRDELRAKLLVPHHGEPAPKLHLSDLTEIEKLPGHSGESMTWYAMENPIDCPDPLGNK